MNYQEKIYLILTETRIATSRKRTSLRKTSAEQEKRKAAGKSLGAYGAGTRARRAKALAKKASKPAAWHARRHHEGEAERLIAHGKRLASNKKGANKFLKRDETKANLAKLTIRSKAQNEGTGYRRRFLRQASRDDDITATEAGTIDAAMYAKVWKDKKGQKKLTKKVAKTIAKRREKENK